jgi:hypothetical protein
MIDAAAIDEIFVTYKKYGWVPRRLLLTAQVKNDLENRFPEIPVTDSDLNAAWFSRPPQSGSVAWEIRHLSNLPYALLENVDEDSDDFEDRLRDVESRLRDAVSKRTSA